MRWERMMQESFLQKIRETQYSVDAYVDPFNKRIRIDDYRGNCKKVINESERLASEFHVEKLIMLIRQEDFDLLLEKGYQCEGKIDRYFLGSDGYFFSKFFDPLRKNSNQWMKEDEILLNASERIHVSKHPSPPNDLQFFQLTDRNALEMSQLYQKVFQVYPTPLHDPNYIKETIKRGTLYFGFMNGQEIISAASVEVNLTYKNAEFTDCATLFEYRKHGLMKILVDKLENVLRENGIFCVYSLARALSFGMNRVLYQKEYRYRGRLTNNCYIFDKLEDMNIWVKDLSHMTES